MNFSSRLSYGRAGEDIVYRFFRSQGWTINQLKPFDALNAPHIILGDVHVKLPDFIMCYGSYCCWGECKRRSRLSYFRIKGDWQFRIRFKYVNDYLMLSKFTGLDFYVFLLIDNQMDDSPHGLWMMKLLQDSYDHINEITGDWYFSIKKMYKLENFKWT